MKWSVSTPPSTSPLDLATVTFHLRLDTTDDTSYVQQVMADVVDYFQQQTDSSVSPQTITATFYQDELSQTLALPRGPVNTITSVTDGNNASVSSSVYSLRRYGNTDVLYFSSMPVAPLTVVYTTGYSSVPNDIRRCLLNLAGTFYENRETISDKQMYDINVNAQRVIDSYKRGRAIG